VTRGFTGYLYIESGGMVVVVTSMSVVAVDERWRCSVVGGGRIPVE